MFEYYNPWKLRKGSIGAKGRLSDTTRCQARSEGDEAVMTGMGKRRNVKRVREALLITKQAKWICFEFLVHFRGISPMRAMPVSNPFVVQGTIVAEALRTDLQINENRTFGVWIGGCQLPIRVKGKQSVKVISVTNPSGVLYTVVIGAVSHDSLRYQHVTQTTVQLPSSPPTMVLAKPWRALQKNL
ncbi:hypothetical protein BJ165DRAFT_1402947 [Panaeolus papilionaceus]|nr:hypothetical protein BJ165DRAFT_1402947 [Panaeolus papilionaceus]